MLDVVNNWGTPRILVIGDLILDHYIYGSIERLAQEWHSPVFSAKSETNMLGGAGNVVAMLSSLGAIVRCASIVSDDEIGAFTWNLVLQHAEDSIKLLSNNPLLKTTVKNRLIHDGMQVFRYDHDNTASLSSSDVERLLWVIRDESWDCIVISDYKRGVCFGHVLSVAYTRANNLCVPIVSDAGPFFQGEVDSFLVRNKHAPIKHGADVITCGADGMIYNSSTIPATKRRVKDTVGAGDMVMASLAMSLASGANRDKAVLLANQMAGLHVERGRQPYMTRDDVRADLGQRSKKIKTLDELLPLLAGKRVSFTNGCFSTFLHPGHIYCLQEAKKQGDVLVVGMNADFSCRRLKGDDRLIVGENERAEMLAALECVDYVVIFAEDDPLKLIQAIKPAVLVKGADWKNRPVVGADLVERVHFVPLLGNYSTSEILNEV